MKKTSEDRVTEPEHRARRHYDRAIRAFQSGRYQGLSSQQREGLLDRLRRERARLPPESRPATA